jgi:hypothetical protein
MWQRKPVPCGLLCQSSSRTQISRCAVRMTIYICEQLGKNCGPGRRFCLDCRSLLIGTSTVLLTVICQHAGAYDCWLFAWLPAYLPACLLACMFAALFSDVREAYVLELNEEVRKNPSLWIALREGNRTSSADHLKMFGSKAGYTRRVETHSSRVGFSLAAHVASFIPRDVSGKSAALLSSKKCLLTWQARPPEGGRRR